MEVAVTTYGLAKQLGQHDAERIDQPPRLLKMTTSRDLERRMKDPSRVEVVKDGFKSNVDGWPVDRADVIDQCASRWATPGSGHLQDLEEVVVERRWD